MYEFTWNKKSAKNRRSLLAKMWNLSSLSAKYSEKGSGGGSAEQHPHPTSDIEYLHGEQLSALPLGSSTASCRSSSPPASTKRRIFTLELIGYLSLFENTIKSLLTPVQQRTWRNALQSLTKYKYFQDFSTFGIVQTATMVLVLKQSQLVDQTRIFRSRTQNAFFAVLLDFFEIRSLPT